MPNRDGLDIIHILWDGPISSKDVTNGNVPLELQQIVTNDYGIYQIYGSHSVLGADALLYIGQANSNPFLNRLAVHEKEWGRWEPSKLDIYLGRLAGTTPVASDGEWGIQIDVVEKVLIYKVAPPYNSSRVKSLNLDRRVLLVNHGRRHRLPECVSNITEWDNRDRGLEAYESEYRPAAPPEAEQAEQNERRTSRK